MSIPFSRMGNGVVERKHRTILGIARSLKFQAGVPLKFWGEYVDTAVYLLNRIPSKILHYKSPYELLQQLALSLSHLKVFGGLGYASSTHCSDKFVARAITCVFMGYSSTQKGYKQYDLHTRLLHL